MKLTRTQYKEIKGYNREQLERYLSDLYAAAYNKGISDMGKEMTKRVDEGIRNTPGIGEKRYTEIISNINLELTKNAKKEVKKDESTNCEGC